jgi:hypothetical protein
VDFEDTHKASFLSSSFFRSCAAFLRDVFHSVFAPFGFFGLLFVERPWFVTSSLDFCLPLSPYQYVDFGLGLFVSVKVADM